MPATAPRPVDVELGRRIEAARRAADVSKQQTRMYETASNRVSVSRLWAIARALNKPMTSFVDGLDELKGPASHEVRKMRFTVVGIHDESRETVSHNVKAANWIEAAIEAAVPHGGAFNLMVVLEGTVDWVGTWENLPGAQTDWQRPPGARLEVFTVVLFDFVGDRSVVEYVRHYHWVEAARLAMARMEEAAPPTVRLIGNLGPTPVQEPAYQFVAAARGEVVPARDEKGRSAGLWQHFRSAA